MRRHALFLDRDGVLVRDVHDLTREDQLEVLPGVPHALRRAADAGFALVVVTNQPVIARGWVTEDDVARIHAHLADVLVAAGAPRLDAFHVCPHHPDADLARYRIDCACRKPRPGLLLGAARAMDLDLGASILVGDRLSDVAAGQAAGCATVLVETGMHLAPPIRSSAYPTRIPTPDARCADLPAAVELVLARGPRA